MARGSLDFEARRSLPSFQRRNGGIETGSARDFGKAFGIRSPACAVAVADRDRDARTRPARRASTGRKASAGSR
jgi:hypothetical protein